MNKRIISTILIGLSTTFVTPAVNAYAAEAKVATAAAENGWVQSGSNWYYYINGKKHTGWIKPGNVWYFMNAEGVMQTGWVQDKGNWYYLDNTGAMKTGWVQVSNQWYFMNTDGVMQTGWVQDKGYWYYLNPVSDGTRGAMKTGWVTIEGKSYYLNPNEGGPKGAMLANTYTPDGYYVNASGVWDGKPASNGQAIVTEAMKHIGKPYVYGATGPNTFDCSGFTQYVYKKVTGKDISRTTYTQINQGVAVSRANLRVGDLVFTSAGHVGIYIGNDKMIHAPQTGDVIKTSNIWSFYAARRIL